MLLKMGHLAHSIDVRASRLEAEVPKMIKRAISIALTPLKAYINVLTARVEVCERGDGAIDAVTTFKADVVELRMDVDHLKSTYFTSLFGMVEIPNDSSIDILAYFEVPLDTTEDDIRADVAAAESEAETYEEQLGVHEETIYESLTDLEEVMVHAAVQTSLKDTTMVSSSGAKADETPNTDALDKWMCQP
ncbi:hypothetical protein H5410_004981 [Solanum commersonii]|uniref:Polyprotein protein n=1 Tax=Solanum commersonii TaxID=4109 RepID=A0A9J6A654_SOLCO|nr:hypothetical protein H5410_004981 [Solanum commersonii]